MSMIERLPARIGARISWTISDRGDEPLTREGEVIGLTRWLEDDAVAEPGKVMVVRGDDGRVFGCPVASPDWQLLR